MADIDVADYICGRTNEDPVKEELQRVSGYHDPDLLAGQGYDEDFVQPMTYEELMYDQGYDEELIIH